MKSFSIVVLAVFGMLIAGCQSLPWNRYDLRDDVFDYDGMPDSKFLVGGGYFIIYRADVEGELFLVDESSERLLATVSLTSGGTPQATAASATRSVAAGARAAIPSASSSSSVVSSANR